MAENKESLSSHIKWLVGIFGVLIVSSIWHVAVISTDVKAVKDVQKDKVDNIVLMNYINTLETMRKQDKEFYLEDKKNQQEMNKEFIKAVTNLEIAINAITTCD